MFNVICPKDCERLRRSTLKVLSKCDAMWQKMLLIPRSPAGNPDLIKKYNLIEVL